jgi:MOSC domain-containing protein YiiM
MSASGVGQPTGRVLSVNVGPVAERQTARGSIGQTGISKQPISGPVHVERTGLAGDSSAWRSRDLGDTAVHAWCLESYERLNSRIGRTLPLPCFGENLTIAGYTEDDAQVGDIIRIGTTLLQVNQPVVRCSWPGVLAAEPRLARMVTQAGLTGFYLTVLEPGLVQAGDSLTVLQRAENSMSIAALNRLLNSRPPDPATARAALALPDLAERWKVSLRKATQD